MNSSLVQSFDCQEYVELQSIKDALLLHADIPDDTCFQLKYDGIWARVVIHEGMVRIYSKTEQLKHSFALDRQLPTLNKLPVVLIAEYMYGTQWAKKKDREGLLYVFDCLVINGQDISTIPYKERHRLAQTTVGDLGSKFGMVTNYNTTKLAEIWAHLEESHAYEGIVLRKLSSTYFTKLHKMKTEVEDDFVCMRMNLGQPEGKYGNTLGSITVGKFRGNELVEIMDVSGFSDVERNHFWTHGKDIVGRTCLIRGKARFDSGALRHPHFIRVRDDKFPQECKL